MGTRQILFSFIWLNLFQINDYFKMEYGICPKMEYGICPEITEGEIGMIHKVISKSVLSVKYISYKTWKGSHKH